MTANLLFAVGTLLSWVGWFLALRAVALIANLFARNRSMAVPAMSESPTGILPVAPEERGEHGRDAHSASLLSTAVAAGVCLAVASALPMTVDKGVVKADFRFPLVWFVMPWSAWMIVICVVFAATRALQAGLSNFAHERLERSKACAVWLVVGVVFGWLYRRDPGNEIVVLKGGVGLTATSAAALALFAIAGTFAMAIAGRAAASRGFAKSIVTQAALIAGSIVFGLPFAFLVITSFKEDRDLSSSGGIVWIPRVQDTRPYFDPSDPVYEGSFEGQPAQGSIIERNADGTVKVDIQRPMAIRGLTFTAPLGSLKQIPKDAPVVEGDYQGVHFTGMVIHQQDDGRRDVQFTAPPALANQHALFKEDDIKPVRHIGLRTQNYSEALDFLPPGTDHGLVYLKNTLLIVVFSVIGTILSSSVVAYAFSRMKFPAKEPLFALVLGTMMLPGAVTLMPQFLIFRWFGWIDTLLPLWVPAFFGSAFNIFLLRQFFMQIPMELEDAAKIDGCSYPKTFWSIMMPQIKPALAVIAIWTFMAAWNNFMGPLIYINSPENMTLSYALKLFQGDRQNDPGLIMAFATLTMLPVLALFFFCQRYFIEGVTLSGLGGR